MGQPQLRHVTPIIELTEDCNLGCRYCYTGSAFLPLGKRLRINQRFEEAVPFLLDAFGQLANYNCRHSTLIIFHGGEPLLIQPSSWRKLLEPAAQRYGDFLKFGIQTNGTFIDNDYCTIFKEFGFEVGVSLDGPAALNDITRPTKSGNSTFNSVWNGINKLRENEVRFGVLVTLTAKNASYIRQIYDFFVSENIHFSIRPIFGSAFADVEEFRLEPLEYADAFCELFDLWFDDPAVDFSLISEFSTMMAQFAEPIEGWVSCSFTKACSEHFVSFDLSGNVSPCNRFHGNAEFSYGNLREQTLESLLQGRRPKALSKRWEILSKSECEPCEMKQFCYGGCPANNVGTGKSYFARDFYCEAYKAIHRHVTGRMRETLASAH